MRQQLNVRMSQGLVMTQNLQQAIKLLQLSKLELETLIHKELQENPVLEEIANESEATPEEIRNTEASTQEIEAGNGNMEEVDVDYFFQDYVEYQTRRSMREQVEIPSYENTLAQQTSLSDHLTWQLQFSGLNEVEQRIGDAIIGNLNDDGYLRASNEEIAEMLAVDKEEVEGIRLTVMRFDPIGIATRDLQECLLSQMKILRLDSPLAVTLIEQHLGDLQNRDYDKIRSSCKCTAAEVHEALETIRSLDPKPGSKYANPDSQYIEPDIFIVRDGDDYALILNEENLPQLQISSDYQQMLKNKALIEVDTGSYLKEKMSSAKWLLKSFVQRQQTIYKVVTSIVERQREFLDKGMEHLKPMILSDIAEDIEMHESTVSRVVTNKYAHTPRGVFELKQFFSSSIRTASGDDVSSMAVKRKIKQIVAEENTKKPLSDNKIMGLLTDNGLKIARRTVAKYREELNIPPSKYRKTIT